MPEFTWQVAVEGYDWVENEATHQLGKGTSAAFSNDILMPIKWGQYRTYHPLKEHSGLFRLFASTPPTPNGIRAFANEFGHLGEGGWSTVQPTKGLSFWDEAEREAYYSSLDALQIPQKFELWEWAIEQMRQAVQLWDRIKAGNPAVNAIGKLEKLVDGHLNEARVTASFEISRKPPFQPALHLVPTTLHGALWLQLAQALANNKKFRACDVCGRWFELSPKTARTDKQHCTDACRSRAYRGRKVQARQMAAEGKKPKQIAKALGSDVTTIATWLQQE